MRDRVGGSLAAMLLAVLATALPLDGNAYTLGEVTCALSEGEANLVVAADGPVRYDVFRLEDPHRVVLDLLDAENLAVPALAGADPSGRVVDVRHSLWKDEPGERIVRYVLTTSEPAEFSIEAGAGTLTLCASRSVSAVPQAGPPAPADLAPEEILDMAPSMGKIDPSYEIAAVSIASSPIDPPGGGAPMSLDVQGADIRTVLRSIAEFGRVNIVPDRDVSGPISVRLVDIPWRDALDLVCNAAGLEAAGSGAVLRVATRQTLVNEELDRESTARKREELLPLETAILPVRYASADEMRQSVGFVLTKRGRAEVDVRTNSLLVTDIAERVVQIRAMVADLDTKTLQVEIVAKLVDLDMTASRQLGISWSALNLHSSSERLSASARHQSGLASATTELRFGVIRDFGNIDATIQAMERENKANIISNPSITTVNNRQARILVGKEVPLIVLDESGNPITELKKVGITLEVTPYINSDEMVTMDIHPEVSDLSSQATVQGGIVFTTTEADTRVMVGDGETAVIGGLIRTNETRFEEGIPILRSIPLLGNLFKSSDVRKDRRELLIFITPKIVRGMADAEP